MVDKTDIRQGVPTLSVLKPMAAMESQRGDGLARRTKES